MMFCHIYWRTKNIDDLRGIPLERVNEKKRSCSAMESNHSSTQDLNQRKLSNQQFSEHPHPTIPLPHPLYKAKITFVLPWTLSFSNTFFSTHSSDPRVTFPTSSNIPTSELNGNSGPFFYGHVIVSVEAVAAMRIIRTRLQTAPWSTFAAANPGRRLQLNSRRPNKW